MQSHLSGEESEWFDVEKGILTEKEIDSICLFIYIFSVLGHLS